MQDFADGHPRCILGNAEVAKVTKWVKLLVLSLAKKGQPFVTLTVTFSSNFVFKVINFIFDFFLGISPDCQQPSPLEQFTRFQSITEGIFVCIHIVYQTTLWY